jgi:hypothetical protein
MEIIIVILALRTCALQERSRISTYFIFTMFGLAWVTVFIMGHFWLKASFREYSIFNACG